MPRPYVVGRIRSARPQAATGQEIVIAQNGKPLAKLVPFQPDKAPRVFGRMRGQIWIAEDFDSPLPAGPGGLPSTYHADDLQAVA